MPTYQTPGVYLESVPLTGTAPVTTGVPGFAGFADSPAATDPRGADTPVNTPVALERKEDFASFFAARSDSFLSAAVAGFFENGGRRCYVTRADRGDAAVQATALGDALASLERLTDIDLIAVPDAATLVTREDVTGFKQVQQQMLDQCRRQGDRFAILDGPDKATLAALQIDIGEWRRQLSEGQPEPVNGAIYHPWVTPSKGDAGAMPPCGHIAGIFARTDATVGVFKAPANEELLGITDVQTAIDAAAQAALNTAGVNCLRVFPGRGIRVWGARTLSGQDEWRYVNVRRLFLTLHRWIDRNMAWAAFEPNDLRLWIRVTRELAAYLTDLWRGGAFAGRTADDSFYVKCDAETNPPEMRDTGSVVTEIGLAPSSPAEFIVVRITHRNAVNP